MRHCARDGWHIQCLTQEWKMVTILQVAIAFISDVMIVLLVDTISIYWGHIILFHIYQTYRYSFSRVEAIYDDFLWVSIESGSGKITVKYAGYLTKRCTIVLWVRISNLNYRQILFSEKWTEYGNYIYTLNESNFKKFKYNLFRKYE